MSEVFGCIKKTASIAWALIEFGILIWALVTLPSIREMWLRTAPEHATVLTVQMPGFWGPVHALVPLNCSRFATNDKIVESMQEEAEEEESGHEEEEGNEKEQHEEAEPKKSQQHKSKSARLLSSFMESRAVESRDSEGLAIASEDILHLVDQEDQEASRMLEEVDTDESSGVTYTDTHVIVKRCGRELTFLRPTRSQNFWAMTWASGWDSMQELRSTRCRMLWLLVAICLLENIFNLITAILPRSALKWMVPQDSPTYEQLEQAEKVEQERKEAREKLGCCTILCVKGCEVVCTLPCQLMQKYVSIQGQMAILSLFFLFWYDDYYITTYVPGKAYLATIVLDVSWPFLFLAFYSGNYVCIACASCITCILAITLLPFVFCMMGFGFYQMNFLWNTCMVDVVHEQSFGLIHSKSGTQYLEHTQLIEAEWKENSDALRSVCDWLFGAHSYDFIVGFGLQLFEVVLLAVGLL